jgi:hypothetical protein
MSKPTVAALQSQITILTEMLGQAIAMAESADAARKAEIAALTERLDAKQPAVQAATQSPLGRALAAAPAGTRRAAYFRAHPKATYVSTTDVELWVATL